MTTVVALILSLMYTGLKGIHAKNEAIYNKKAILNAIQSELPTDVASMDPAAIQDIFTNNIKQEVYDMKGNIVTKEAIEARGYKGGMAEHVDMAKEKKRPEAERLLPVYTYSKDNKKMYILSIRGNGLWDEIWGNIALESDLKTIAGVDFDHKGETPGLGAEIKDNKAWKAQFIGKKIYSAAGAYQPIAIIKGGVKQAADYKIDGISGATITADGVQDMMANGLKRYEPVFNKLKS